MASEFDGLSREEVQELLRIRRKVMSLTDAEHVTWAKGAVRRDIKTALDRIEDPNEKERLFEELQQVLDKVRGG
jgi:hypothetical protein